MKNRMIKYGIAFALILLVTPINIQALSEDLEEDNQTIEVVMDEEEVNEEDVDLEEELEEPEETVDPEIETDQETDTSIPQPQPTPEPEQSPNRDEDYDKTAPDIEEVIEKDELDEEEIETKFLIQKVNIYSISEESEDEKNHSIETTNDRFSYQYTLPKYIESFKVDVETIQEAVVTVFDREYTISEGQDSVLVSIEAGTDKQYQVYELEILKNDNKSVVIKVNNSSLEVYDGKNLILQ